MDDRRSLMYQRDPHSVSGDRGSVSGGQCLMEEVSSSRRHHRRRRLRGRTSTVDCSVITRSATTTTVNKVLSKNNQVGYQQSLCSLLVISLSQLSLAIPPVVWRLGVRPTCASAATLFCFMASVTFLQLNAVLSAEW